VFVISDPEHVIVRLKTLKKVKGMRMRKRRRRRIARWKRKRR
jgi:hypothetical protein